MKEKNYITPFGLKRLIDERDFLLKIERPKVVSVVSWAASLGDRSENADYIYGKKRLREIDRRLKFLGKRINLALIVDPLSIKSKTIQFGASVIFREESGEEKKVTIVGIDEINIEKGMISWKSPIGKTLLGKMVGDFCTVIKPNGEIELEIVDLDYKEISIDRYKEESWK
tara:strand:+ start:350 stop:862 length:513 start_codon:yes stop_codon:yes gene_type:complete